MLAAIAKAAGRSLKQTCSMAVKLTSPLEGTQAWTLNAYIEPGHERNTDCRGRYGGRWLWYGCKRLMHDAQEASRCPGAHAFRASTLQPHWLSTPSCDTDCGGLHSQRIPEAHRELDAHLPLLLQLLLVRPAGHVGIAVGPSILPQLVHEEAVEEVALGAKACLALLAVSHLFRHHSRISQAASLRLIEPLRGIQEQVKEEVERLQSIHSSCTEQLIEAQHSGMSLQYASMDSADLLLYWSTRAGIPATV